MIFFVYHCSLLFHFLTHKRNRLHWLSRFWLNFRFIVVFFKGFTISFRSYLSFLLPFFRTSHFLSFLLRICIFHSMICLIKSMYVFAYIAFACKDNCRLFWIEFYYLFSSCFNFWCKTSYISKLRPIVFLFKFVHIFSQCKAIIIYFWTKHIFLKGLCFRLREYLSYDLCTDHSLKIQKSIRRKGSPLIHFLWVRIYHLIILFPFVHDFAWNNEFVLNRLVITIISIKIKNQ